MVKWTKIVPIPMLECYSNLFPYRKLEAKSIKFASEDPPPSPQTRSPSTPCLCDCCNHAVSDLSGLWETSQLFPLSYSPDPIVSACGPSSFLFSPPWVCRSFHTGLHPVPHLWSLSAPCCGVPGSLTHSFSSFKCFRGSPPSSRHRANLSA